VEFAGFELEIAPNKAGEAAYFACREITGVTFDF
jgi:hypothetical protein